MVETRFKHTEIGIIPEDWEVKVFTDLFTFLSTAPYSRSDIDNHSYTGYIHYGDIHTKIGYHLDTDKFVSGYISDDKLKSYSYLKQSDLIMADASEDYSGVGKGFEVINVPDLPVISGLHTFLLREKGKKFALGFKGYFHSNPIIKKQYDALATGLKVYSLSKSVFNKIYIPIPPLFEQQAIAETLTHTDEWIEGLEKLIAKKRLIKQGVMQTLLTPKKDWDVKKLEEIAEVIMGQSPLSRFYNQNGEGLPLIQGNADIDNRKTITRNYTSQITKKGKAGDTIMSVRAPVGEIAKATTDCCLGRGVCALRYLNDYLYHYLIFSENQWLQFSTGSTFDSVNSDQIKEFKINLPKSLDEQKQIAEILSDMDFEIETLEEKLAKAKQIKQGMMQELLTGRIRLIESSNKSRNHKFKKATVNM